MIVEREAFLFVGVFSFFPFPLLDGLKWPKDVIVSSAPGRNDWVA